MSDDELNEALAKLLGWKDNRAGSSWRMNWIDPDGDGHESAPRFTDDLNLVHSVVTAKLAPDEAQAFAWAVYKLLRPGQLIVNADAKQRAEALYQVLLNQDNY